jgi:hypothetical protein
MKTIKRLVCGSALLFSLSLAFHASAEQVILVPTDPSTKYIVLDITRQPNGLVEITTQRDGKSGTTYSKRLVDCANATFKYLGEGDTVEAMRNSKPDPNMAELVSGSISMYASEYACQNAR